MRATFERSMRFFGAQGIAPRGRLRLTRCSYGCIRSVAQLCGFHDPHAREIKSDTSVLDFTCNDLGGVEQLELLVTNSLVAT
ncbi:MAG: hypothetical protein ACREP1_07520, partial [Rhodanobacteraceae bacterium]